MATKLSERQRKSLFAVSRKAWNQIAGTGAYGSYEEFRRTLSTQHCGQDSFTQLSNSDYGRLYDAFAGIAGEANPAKSYQTYTPHAKAVHFLKDAIMRFELPLVYMAKLIRDKFHITIEAGWTLDDMCAMLKPGQVWQLVYTVNNRGRAKVRREIDALGLDEPPIEHHATQPSVPPERLADHFNIRGPGKR
ncbi:hypothetical protein [Akkermansia glycaniphila]|uniref:Uncharacterized protein n=1 Tax=Akkermansia glycaniphila TaxID=1679444 RepID=A0A1C7P9R6_9BACT|nr:hypothetical protein [Akkermansia glycaniphila]OCA02290.1 hypothetical protein AC781_10690 [Akkermansia glycaniphila]SEH87208.1 Hypothetical protein PYTT_1354 [Akkermansia glycaniphila]